jgi:TRAP-type C4-dicarboxylate transport system permease small subunit
MVPFDRVITAITGTLFVLGVASTMLGALGRQFGQIMPDVSWSIELTILPIITALLLIIPRGFRENTHMAITLLPSRLPERWFRILTVFNQLLMIGFFFIIARYGLDVMALNQAQRTPVLGLSVGWIYIVIVVSGVLLVVEGVIRLLEALLGRAPRPEDSDRSTA